MMLKTYLRNFIMRHKNLVKQVAEYAEDIIEKFYDNREDIL